MRHQTYRPGTHINLKEDFVTRTVKKITPYLVGFLALYGFGELALRANGL